jgi:hypothetical protein
MYFLKRRIARRIAARLVYLKGTREDSGREPRLVAEPASADPFRKEETMSEEKLSEEKLQQDEREDEDVEAHGHETVRRGHETLRSTAASEELGDENDDVEAHRRRSS